MEKVILLFFILIFLYLPGYSFSTHDKANKMLQSDSSFVKLADKPQDRPIRIVTHDNYELCYIPTFSLGAQNYSYVGILNCVLREAKNARYDVFSRLAFNISNNWLCITAPYSVAVMKREFDYVYLSPCVINDSAQRWKIKNGSFYSFDGSYMIKDDGSYLYAVWSKDKKFYRHILHPSMRQWQDTLATPGNISIVTYLAWDLMTKDGNQRYFIKNNQSQKNTTPLYYNIDSGHIAQYDGLSGSLYCMYSKLGKKSDWDWVEWALCDDTKPPLDNKAFFKFVFVGDQKVILKDQDENILRFTRYGIHWGVPYMVNPKYLSKDTYNAAISELSIPEETQDWLRFALANAGENLAFCPAPAKNTLANSPLLPHFVLTQEWKQRLINIARSTDGTIGHMNGVCGVCLLHSYQILGEILENPNGSPRRSGGYFFDTRDGMDPFVSFRQRNSLLYDTFGDMESWFVQARPRSHDDIFMNTTNLALASSISMLPQYNWNIFAYANNQAQINDTLQRIINSSVGNVFILFSIALTPQRNFSGHAFIMLRLEQGVIMLPTNIFGLTPQTFDRITTAFNDVPSMLTVFNQIASLPSSRIVALGVINANTSYPNVFQNFVSVSNCTGEGEYRRGSGGFPSAQLINQCGSGARCAGF